MNNNGAGPDALPVFFDDALCLHCSALPAFRLVPIQQRRHLLFDAVAVLPDMAQRGGIQVMVQLLRFRGEVHHVEDVEFAAQFRVLPLELIGVNHKVTLSPKIKVAQQKPRHEKRGPCCRQANSMIRKECTEIQGAFLPKKNHSFPSFLLN